jgi:uncharacterized protein (DUF4415 family)
MAIIKKNLTEMKNAKRMTKKEAAAIIAKLSKKQLVTLAKEDKKYDFTGGRRTQIRFGRPPKEITRELASIRIPAPALRKLHSLGKGWSTIAGNVLTEWANKQVA